MNSNWLTPKGAGGVEASARAQQATAQQQSNILQQQQQQQQDAYNRYIGSLSGTDSAANNLLMSMTSSARANQTPFMPSNMSAFIQSPTNPGSAPAYTAQNYAGKVGSAPTYTAQNYASQVASPQTDYSKQVNTNAQGDWNTPSGSQYTLSPEVLAQLYGGASPEDIQKQVQNAYGTLNSLNLQQYGNTTQNAMAGEMARRGITDSSGAFNKRVGLSNALTTQGAQMNAQGVLASLQAAEEARNARNGALLSGEGLKQQAASSALGLGTTQEQIRANRAAEQLAALQTASGLQQNYASGKNEALSLAQQLNSGELNNALAAYNAGLTGLQTQSGLSTDELNRQNSAYNAGLAGLQTQSGLSTDELNRQNSAYNAGLAGLQTQSGLSTDELNRQNSAYNTALNGNLAYTQAANEAVNQQAGLSQQAYQNAVTNYGLEQANQMYKDQALQAYLQYLQQQQGQYLGMVNPSALTQGYANLGQTYGNIGQQYGQIGANQMNLLGSLAGVAGTYYGQK